MKAIKLIRITIIAENIEGGGGRGQGGGEGGRETVGTFDTGGIINFTYQNGRNPI